MENKIFNRIIPSFKHVLCEECVEYVCHHNYPCLDLSQDKCPICVENMTSENTVYLNNCAHKIHLNCAINIEIHENIRIEEEHQNNMMELKNELRHLELLLQISIFNSTRNRIKSEIIELKHIITFIQNKYIERKLEKTLKMNIKCPYCRIYSTSTFSYNDIYKMCCNSVLPPLPKKNGRLIHMTIIAYEYNKKYEEYKCRLYPTEEMKEYISDCQELMGSIWKKQEKFVKKVFVKKKTFKL